MAAVQAIGLMSVTSLDGVDVAVIETDGERVSAFGPTGYRAYTEGELALLREALTDAVAMRERAERRQCPQRSSESAPAKAVSAR